MNNILVTGAGGQLGSELKRLERNYPNYNIFFTDKSELDITDHNNVKKFLKKNNINFIINCAAYTQVEKAEFEAELANKINHLAVANIAHLARQKNIKLVHISTDYVFDGNTKNPYLENDETKPLSVYGKTKLDGELAIKKINPKNSIVLRTSWLYSKSGKNFYSTMIRLSRANDHINVVSDQTGSPTNAKDLATIILKILPKIDNSSVEIYHYSNEGACSWYDFAKKIFESNRIDVILKAVKSTDYSDRVKRPIYSVLNTSLIKNKFDIKIPNWEDSLENDS
ncbi:MAG: dTDP-4-dehydrorhamnose reductase [Flavobacteriaceae bacterium]|nr:dTDP-4-dehydrorhamnose reductase [Flavobacteriaceae bacterium]|tara:strand:+ start:4332 stop:5180 length:849 start_codon:yes stop_codon:yes gene_type:complete